MCVRVCVRVRDRRVLENPISDVISPTVPAHAFLIVKRGIRIESPEVSDYAVAHYTNLFTKCPRTVSIFQFSAFKIVQIANVTTFIKYSNSNLFRKASGYQYFLFVGVAAPCY